MVEPKAALDGIKVADFTWLLAGPLITKCLADHGATVVRVESMQHIDAERVTFPYKDGKPGVNRAGYFAHYNGNKLSLGINMNHSKGVAIAKRLAAWADILVENFSAGTMERWDMGYEQLSRINPGLIMIRCTNQGQSGPLSKHPCYGVQLAPFAGFAELIGWPDQDPMPLINAWTDFLAPQFTMVALLAALDRRNNTGRGELLDVSQLEASLHFLEPIILDQVVNGRSNKRSGNSCSYAVPHNVYRCLGEERWCAIAIFTDAEWESLCRVMGNPQWSKDVRFCTFLGRRQNEAELDRLLQSWTINMSAEEVMDTLQSAGIDAGVVKNGRDIYEDPQVKYRNQFWLLEHQELGKFPHMGEPFILSKTPARPYRAAPLVGEHTVHVCKKMLGMTDEEFDELILDGALE